MGIIMILRGKLIEIGDDHMVLDELDEGGEKYTGEKIYTFNGIHSITKYR